MVVTDTQMLSSVGIHLIELLNLSVFGPVF